MAVVGGGVVGVSVALELARRGVSVAVLERGRVGHGCSYGNAGWLTPSLSVPLPAPGMFWKSLRWMFDPESPLYIQPRLDPALARWLAGFLWATRRSTFERGAAALLQLCRWSVDRWEELAGQGDDFGFARRGLVCVYETAKVSPPAGPMPSWSGGKAASATTCGPRTRCASASRRWSARRWAPSSIRTTPTASPTAPMQALAAAAAGAGAAIFEDTEVFGIAESGGQVRHLRTTRGQLVAKKVVIAAGAWCSELGRLLGRRVPILGAKGIRCWCRASIRIPPARSTSPNARWRSTRTAIPCASPALSSW